jgi:hypothetical protein
VWRGFPGVVRLVMPVPNSNPARDFVCTGTLVNPTVILTAPQCLPGEPTTLPDDWVGSNITLGPAFKVYAGDVGATYLGFLSYAAYVNYNIEGGQLAAAQFVRAPAADALLGNLSYYYQDVAPVRQNLGITIGYGASLSTKTTDTPPRVIQTGGNIARNATTLLTRLAYPASQVKPCTLSETAPQLFSSYYKLEQNGVLLNEYNTFRFCQASGDLGAPMFIRSAPGVMPWRWELAGVFIGATGTARFDADCLGPLADQSVEMAFTCVAFRAAWIHNVLLTAAAVPPAPIVCPSQSGTPSPSVTPSLTPSPTSAATLAAIPSPSASPLPFIAQPQNVLWIAIFGAFFSLLACSVLAYGLYKHLQVVGFHVVSKADRAVLAQPSLKQKAPVVVTPYEAAEVDRASKAREGIQTSQLRRMSVVPPSAEQLAEAEASKAARRARRKSQAEEDGVLAVGRRSSVSGLAARRGSVVVATVPVLVQPGAAAVVANAKPARRASLAMAREAERQYETGAGGAAGLAMRFSEYKKEEVHVSIPGQVRNDVESRGSTQPEPEEEEGEE